MTRLLHRIWLGPSPMPDEYKAYGSRWTTLNPDVTLMEWSWHNLPEALPCLDVMNDLRSRCTSGLSTELPTQLADILGYWTVYAYGGIYSNADILPMRSVPEAMWEEDFATYEEKDYPLVVNAFIGGIRGSLFWKFVLDGISQSYFSKPAGTEMVFTTGPVYLTERLKQWSDSTSVHIYPYDTVNPVLWKQVPQGGKSSDVIDLNNLPSNTIGVHQWGHRKTGRSNVVR